VLSLKLIGFGFAVNYILFNSNGVHRKMVAVTPGFNVLKSGLSALITTELARIPHLKLPSVQSYLL